jgi:hypothetical protein
MFWTAQNSVGAMEIAFSVPLQPPISAQQKTCHFSTTDKACWPLLIQSPFSRAWRNLYLYLEKCCRSVTNSSNTRKQDRAKSNPRDYHKAGILTMLCSLISRSPRIERAKPKLIPHQIPENGRTHPVAAAVFFILRRVDCANRLLSKIYSQNFPCISSGHV